MTPSMALNGKQLWFFFNLAFIINYTLRLLRPFIRLPIPALPRFVNSLLLLSVYLSAIAPMYNRPNKFFSHTNFLCACLFATFPHPCILFPFYLLSIFHTTQHFLKTRYAKASTGGQHAFFLPFCFWVQENAVSFSKLAMLLEILNIPISILLYFFRMSSLKTIFMLFMIVRQQYISSVVMKSIVDDLWVKTDGYLSSLPADYQGAYRKVKNLFSSSSLPESKKAE